MMGLLDSAPRGASDHDILRKCTDGPIVSPAVSPLTSVNRSPSAPAGIVLRCLLALLAFPAFAQEKQTLQQQNEELFRSLGKGLELSESQISAVRAIFAKSPVLSQGNPAITKHPMSPEQCRERRAADRDQVDDGDFERICGAKNMAPLYAAGQKPGDAVACIDRYEFPNLPCEYPVIWVRARQAQEICAAIGKRMCDAHEWEGACAGSLEEPDYNFALAKGADASSAVSRMRSAHNRVHAGSKVWSYGKEHKKGVCAMASTKSAGCNGGDWKACGSNTYPAGAFPACRSPLGVYDLNGNAAEHMNLPLAPDQMASRGSDKLGVTEMKGSWFIFDHYQAHEDWCRWRAPYWHGSRVMDPKSHENYHLGFRCCKSLDSPPASAP